MRSNIVKIAFVSVDANSRRSEPCSDITVLPVRLWFWELHISKHKNITFYEAAWPFDEKELGAKRT